MARYLLLQTRVCVLVTPRSESQHLGRALASFLESSRRRGMMVPSCKAARPGSTEGSCCLIIAKFPRAWDGKAEACCTIRVNYPGGETTSGSTAVATFLFLIPTLPHPQDSRNVRLKQASVQPGRAPAPSMMQLVLGGCSLPPEGPGRCSQTSAELCSDCTPRPGIRPASFPRGVNASP